MGRRLALALTAYFFLPCAFLLVYVFAYRAPTSAILPHIWLMLGPLAGLIGFKLALSALPFHDRIRAVLNGLVVLCVALTMVTFYVLVFVGLTYWGRVTTVDLARTYLLQVSDLLRTLGYEPLVTAIALLLVLVVGWFVAYAYQARLDWSRQLSNLVSRAVRVIAAIGLFGVATIAYVAFPDRDWGSRAEPVSLSIYPDRGTVVMQNHSIDIFRAARIDQEDDAARAAYQPNAIAKRSNVVLIVVDALRADHLSLFGYARKTTPNLQRRADAGEMKLGTSAVSVCNESSCGLRALASSRYLDRQAARPITLHEVLKRHGYRIDLLLSGDHTNFYGLRDIYGPVDSYFDAVHQTARYINDDRLVIDQMQKLAPWDGKPTLLQFHLMSAHALGQRFEETPSYGPGENYTAFRAGSSDPDLPQRSTNFYDRGVLQADWMIEQILRRLDEQGYLRDAVVVITGDHGESLGERGRYSHTHSVWEEALRVPFLMFSYGGIDVAPIPAARVMSQVDIASTILHELQIPLPISWQGVPAQLPSRPNFIYFQQAELFGLLDDRWPGKLYKHWRSARSSETFTFDLLDDPFERINIADELPSSLTGEWKEILAGQSIFSTSSLRKH